MELWDEKSKSYFAVAIHAMIFIVCCKVPLKPFATELQTSQENGIKSDPIFYN